MSPPSRYLVWSVAFALAGVAFESAANARQGAVPLTRSGYEVVARVTSAGSSSDSATLVGGFKLRIDSEGKDLEGFCQEATIDTDIIIRLCGDDDGCSLHLTSDSLVRALSDVVRLQLNIPLRPRRSW